jgi:integrase
MGKSLISVGDEKPRERILTLEEEARLLAACEDPRAHLRAILICALDTGMRRGELFSLTWADVDFENRLITIRAFNTKTMRERRVGMAVRLKLAENSHYDCTSVRG